MDIALKLLLLVCVVSGVGFLVVRDMEKSSTTEVGGLTLNLPASATAGIVALVGGGIGAYFLLG